jgi:putative addiction module component (TIGR02574 family)
MRMTLDELTKAALALSAQERGKLAHFLIQSLDEAEENVDEAAVRAEWLEVAHQRMLDVEAGKVVGIPAEEVLRGLLRTKSQG